MCPGVTTHRVRQQGHKLYIRLDYKYIDESEPALLKALPVHIDCEVTNNDRASGTSLSYKVSKLYGEGLPPARDTIHICMKGSAAGQSCGAFLAPGITIELGGRLIVYPPKQSLFIDKAEENIIIGNTCLYGGTNGEHSFVE